MTEIVMKRYVIKLYSAIHVYEAEVKTGIAIVNEKIKEKYGEINEAEAMLHQIKTQKMLEPERAEGTELFRSKLKETGQAFLPFYAAVEFAEHVTEEQRERIESALKKTGILDSLITENPLLPEQDAVIVTEPRILGFTLADYLIPDLDEDSPISTKLVDEVLRSIPLEHDGSGFHIDVDGKYSIGCLVGHAPKEGSSKFIGRTSRKRHQREQIQLWNDKLMKLQIEMDDLNNKLRSLDEELEMIQAWKEELPNDRELLDLHEQIMAKQQVMKSEKEMLRKIDEEWKFTFQKLTDVKKELREQGKHMNISLGSMKLSSIESSGKLCRIFVPIQTCFTAAFVYSKAILVDSDENTRKRRRIGQLKRGTKQ